MWPARFGGRGLSPLECAIIDEAFVLAGAPRTVLGIGRLVAPTVARARRRSAATTVPAPGMLAGLALGQAVGPAGSLHEVLASEHHRAFGELALDLLGADAMMTPAGDEPLDKWQRTFFGSRSRCISRDTNEVQRNVIDERLLGLPREPR